eukprot:CAMPEP_0169451486 /NCGR_PEP_ID=MMETSP1042-20121227/13725_1 /TAXON_ID=464988 /ORGANISM="Hemiselmis andersenii, Strain CCMP1180" /LENGTH=197 /DNA_ID=CAMNT_0009563405 /DNA_START=102 /DNA_END=691 /DNA_ORIENTATION=-
MFGGSAQANVHSWLQENGEDILFVRSDPISNGGGGKEEGGKAPPPPECFEDGGEEASMSEASRQDTLHGSLMFLGGLGCSSDIFDGEGGQDAGAGHFSPPPFHRASSCGQKVERAQLERASPFSPRIRPRLDLHRPLLQSSLELDAEGTATAVLVRNEGQAVRHHDSRMDYNIAIGDAIASVVELQSSLQDPQDGGG